jgi:hypothetical protein
MVVIGAGLGLAFLTREIVAAFYGVSVVLVGVLRGFERRGRAAVLDALMGGLVLAGAFGLYLAYNAAVTGWAFILPRLLFDYRDIYGFGEGFGFYNEHTAAAGLVNAEEQLTSLTFYLAGWPFGVSLGLLLVPFLLRRFLAGRGREWDLAHGLLVLLFVGGYVGYYYHGIVLGPRYYFEALPSFVILTARGFGALTDSVTGWLVAVGRLDAWWRARLATMLIAAALFACNLLYFLPRQATLYTGYSGLPGGGPALDGNISHDLAGRVSILSNALVVANDWWPYTYYFAALNCPTLDCPTLFALATDDSTRDFLAEKYPDRAWYNVEEREGVLRIVPGIP